MTGYKKADAVLGALCVVVYVALRIAAVVAAKGYLSNILEKMIAQLDRAELIGGKQFLVFHGYLLFNALMLIFVYPRAGQGRCRS